MPRRGLPGDPNTAQADAVKGLRRRMDKQEQPDGNQLGQALAKVQALITSLPTLITNFLATGFTTGSMVATGSVTANTVVAPVGVSSVGVYNNLLTSGYKVQYINSAGPMGYVPSSRRFKQDEKPAPDMREAALAMQVVTFRYIQAVEELGDAAAVEWGVIAEDLFDLGFLWALDFDDDGLPVGVKKEQLIFAFIPVIQDHEERLRAAGL